MLNPSLLLRLYTRVLEIASLVRDITDEDIKEAIEHMHKIYQASPDSLSKGFSCFTELNKSSYRCAYLFKYAPFHTALSYTAMSHALAENPNELQTVLASLSGPLKICSLGGGPGTDVLGILAAMHERFGFFPSYVKLVDIVSEWESTFYSVLDELSFGRQFYGPLSESVSGGWFDWSFLTANLQGKIKREVAEEIKNADFISMVKFVSAAASDETSNMIEKIFKMMKPGAFVFFIDNAAGGFEELISRAASKHQLNAVSTPLKHKLYRNEALINIKYGYRSCYESKVAMQLLMKSYPIYRSKKIISNVDFSYDENVTPLPVPRWQKIHVPQFQNFRIGPKPIDKPMNWNETFESGSPSYWRERNFSPSSEFSPNLNRLGAQIDSPSSLHDSFESQSFWSSSPYTSNCQNWSIEDRNETFDSGYQNESFRHEMSLGADYSDKVESPHHDNFPLAPPGFWNKNRRVKIKGYRNCSRPVDYHINEHEEFKHGLFRPFQNKPSDSLLPSPVPNNAFLSRLNATNDSGYDESFNSGLSMDSPVCDSSLSFRTPRRVIRYKSETDYSFQENESFTNSSINNLPHLMPHDGNSSLSPMPHRPNLQELNQNNRICFVGNVDSFYDQSPINCESPPFRQPWSSDHQPKGPFKPSYRHPKKCNAPKRLGNFSVRHNPKGPFKPSYRHPKKCFAPKRNFSVRHNPYRFKRI